MILVYGATGFTGRLVCEALAERGVELAVAGRDRARVEALAADVGAAEARAAELWEFEALVGAFDGAKVVVNCCGPFRDTGEVVMRAALRVGAHYLDTTGEQAFMREMYERYESAVRRAGLCFVNAFAFEVALGDWAASLAGLGLGEETVDEVAVAYAVNDFHPSRGTALSALGQMREPGVVWERDRWDPAEPAAEKRTFGFPPPGPLSALASRAGRFVGPLARSPLSGLLRRRAADAPTPTKGQRGINDFAVTATATRNFDTGHVAISGTDVYGCTAAIVAHGAQQLLSGKPTAGLLAPSQAFDAETSLAALPVTVTASF
jgi:short subunit dehydrogenase-like uncharacterized protein